MVEFKARKRLAANGDNLLEGLNMGKFTAAGLLGELPVSEEVKHALAKLSPEGQRTVISAADLLGAGTDFSILDAAARETAKSQQSELACCLRSLYKKSA